MAEQEKKIIWSEEQIRLFATEILDMEHMSDGECVLTTLASRKKYDPTIKMKKIFFRRELITAKNINALVRQAHFYEGGLGHYVDDNDVIMPTKSIVIYVMYHTRDIKRASISLAKEIFDKTTQEPPVSVSNIKSRIFTHMQTHPFDKKWLVLDIDDKSLYDEVTEGLCKINVTPQWIIETQGGYHVYLKSESVTKEIRRELYQNFIKKSSDGKEIITIMKDQFTALPGTIQNGFNVRMFSYYDLDE